MLRILLILLAIVLPFAVYGGWLALERRRKRAWIAGKDRGWETWPWAWLILSSIALVVLSFLIMRIFNLDPDGLIGGPSLIQRDQEGS
ncbi:MAG: hypothetical protein Kilf2KO_35930 [Rhodospirillales bacterium]